MLACIDSLPFKFHSPGQPNMGGDNQQNRRVTREEHHQNKRMDVPITEYGSATDRRYRGTTANERFSQGKFVGLRTTHAAAPRKRSMN